jgi:hypothetical protein
LTGGHPYFTQLFCHVLVDRCNDDQVARVTVQSVRQALDEVLELGRTHLAYVWGTCDGGMRVCLAALADLQARADRVPATAIANQIEGCGLALSPGQVRKTMSLLVAKDLAVKEEGRQANYSLAVQLYAHWLRRYRPLSRVVAG